MAVPQSELTKTSKHQKDMKNISMRLVGQFVVEELPVVVGRICDGVMGVTVSFS